MYLHKTVSTYGRVVPKPAAEENDSEDAIDETPVPIQDQIENLRTKIALKERYNKVISEELEESRQGASSILFDLYNETRELRAKLIDALNAEEAAVQNALRTHRVFQLAMTGRTSSVAIPWLQDTLFDACKKFNALLCYLTAKRKKLEEAESMVIMIEKWPRPGTLPWELDAILEFIRIENKIESVKVKLETATILHSKYYEIKFILREEGGKYLPTLKILENQVENHKKELAGLKKMLVDAYKFLEDSKRNLTLTEREAYDNRKERRRQMGKMKKAVERLLAENANPMPNKRSMLPIIHDFDWLRSSEQELIITDEMLKAKSEKIEVFQDRARRLVDAMRVGDLSQIPARLRTIRALGEHLKAELESKEKLKDVLLKQKAQLFLIQCHFRYTGQKQEDAFKTSKSELDHSVNELEKKIQGVKEKLAFYGNIFIQLRLSVLGIQTFLDEGKGQKNRAIQTELKGQLRNLHTKFNTLIIKVKQLENLFEGRESERDYASFLKPTPLHPRFIRVSSPVPSDDSDDDDEILDSKVPNRQQIKNKGKRVIQQAILRRGLK